ncbi:unnamed protein product [Microthlaspi erraticum]|uniref:F-box domain-containing protein n=1 Tax=Microthlaspi erraticum TaxID=1685480 RepID=A0A6D2HV45_9BRAS|nr:unnamed protein product [Microthlaspi erraticum]
MESTGVSEKKENLSDEFEESSSKRGRCTAVEPDSNFCGFDDIPEDLLIKILLGLPAKPVGMAMCVSHLWYSLIATHEFTKRFMESPSSLKRPPRIMASRVDKEDPRNYAFLTSPEDNNHSDSSEYVFEDVLEMPGMEGVVVNALRGLICLRLGASLRICNLTTRQLVFLPDLTSTLLESEDDDKIWSYFGYDPVYDEYKVLSFVSELSKENDSVVRSEHQVLVLGPEASWRHIESNVPPPPHRPYSRAISIDNMVYYGAWDDKGKSVVMSFDFANEDFVVIEIPPNAGISWGIIRSNIMNYQGKLSVFEYSQAVADVTLNLWIMEDARKKIWSNKTLLFSLPLDYFSDFELSKVIAGTDQRGELMLSNYLEMYGPAFCVTYDLEKMKTTKSFKFFPLGHVLGGKKGWGLDTFIWEDDIEKIMYLET